MKILKSPRLLATAVVVALAAARPAVAQGGKAPPLRMPPGWSDTYLAKMAAGRTPTITVAVTDFTGGSLVDEKLRFRMSDILITELVQAGRFTVVERQQLDAILAEQKLQASGVTDKETAVRVGKLANAELVIYGKVTAIANQKVDKFAYDLMRSEVSIDVYAANSETSELVVSEKAKGVAEAKVVTTASGAVVSGPTDYDALVMDATRQALDRVALRLANAFPLVGVVVRADGGTVHIDAGESRGVKRGDTFVVFRKGNELLHPVTKKVLGFEKTVVATLEVTSTESELATAKVLSTASGASITAGDLVISAGK